MNKIIITIEVPEGTVPDVSYVTSQVDNRDTAPEFNPPLPEPPTDLFPPFPVAAQPEIPVCRIHQKPLVFRPAGLIKSGPRQGEPRGAFWSCGEKDANGNWCRSRQDAA